MPERASTPAKAPPRVPGKRRASGLSAPQVAEDATPLPNSPAPPRAYFLIGENKKLAGDVAEHEWGWTKKGAGWTGGPMPCSGFLADLAAVKKEIAKGAPIAVYHGYRWYAVIAPHLLAQLVVAGSVVEIPAPRVG